MLFLVKNSVSWAKNALIYGMYCILYEVQCANLQLRTKRRICRKNGKNVFGEGYYGHFCPRREAAN